MKKNKKVPMQLINVKKNNLTIENLYIGKFVNIGTDISKNDNNIYYFETFDNKQYKKFTKKISSKYESLCEKYNYGIIYGINEDSYDICIIMEDGFLKTFDVKLNNHYENGSAFFIENNNLIDSNTNKIVGYANFENYNVKINSLDNDKLVCFIQKSN